jgi:hypothetical protein
MMLTLQHPRSNQWPTVRKAWLKDHPTCAACGSIKSLQVHHKFPFHLDPSKELDPANFITLCERIFTDHHLEIGHLGNFKNYNVNVEADAAKMLTAKASKLKAIVFPWQTVQYYDVTSLVPVFNRSHTHTLTPPIGFKSDLYTDFFNLPDPRPAIYHDYAYSTHAWDDGTPMTILEANDLFLLLGQNSTSFWTRFWIGDYFDAVQIYGQSFRDAGLKCQLTFRMMLHA